jgi:hypothetical protein
LQGLRISVHDDNVGMSVHLKTVSKVGSRIAEPNNTDTWGLGAFGGCIRPGISDHDIKGSSDLEKSKASRIRRGWKRKWRLRAVQAQGGCLDFRIAVSVILIARRTGLS